MNNLRVCWRCGDYPDISYELEGVSWCGPCAPWGQTPCPLGPLLELGARVLEQLEREGLSGGRFDAERLVAWLGEAAASWPGPDPWRTVRLATQLQYRLLSLERRLPSPPLPSPSPSYSDTDSHPHSHASCKFAQEGDDGQFRLG